MSGTVALLFVLLGCGVMLIGLGSIGNSVALSRRIDRLERTLREHGIYE